MERVDVVNENNQVIGQASKADCHKKGLLHRTIIAEIIDSQGNWVLIKQSSDRQDAGQYVSPVGGHIRAGESELEALKREAEEETGLTQFSHKYIGKAIFNREVIGRKENHYFILYEISSDEELILNHESESYRRFSKDEIQELMKTQPKMFGDAFHFVMKQMYKQNKKNA